MEQKQIEGLEARLTNIEGQIGGAPGHKVIVDITAGLLGISGTPIVLIPAIPGETIIDAEIAIIGKDTGGGLGDCPKDLKVTYQGQLGFEGDPIAVFGFEFFTPTEDFLIRPKKRVDNIWQSPGGFPEGKAVVLTSDQNGAPQGQWKLIMTYSTI